MLHSLYHGLAWTWGGDGQGGADGTGYLITSGPLQFIAWPLAALAIMRRLNCHAKGCWRVARHPVEGTPYRVCRHHHPDLPDECSTAEEIAEAHEQACH